MTARVGVDVGGTFTDVVVEAEGEILVSKVPTTPGRVAGGVLEAVAATGCPLGEIRLLVHGTTVGTNTLLERNGARVGLVTTEGFEDVLEIQRGDRRHLYDLAWTKPEPLVPRPLRRGVPERVGPDGEEVLPLDAGRTEEVARALAAEGVESIALCFLFSFANPDHERRAKGILEEVAGVPISVSSELLPEIREYERTSTVVIDAYVKPRLREYLGSLEQELRRGGFGGGLSVMQSNGGVSSAAHCADRPSHTLLSGPAAGVVAGARFAERCGLPLAATLDMGGTSCDVSVIEAGHVPFTTEQELEWGVPIALPAVDVRTIGAGGGSIAWIDPGGRLKVGPQSAGAVPGPACYGRGGTRPTVTDANLVLGALGAGQLLGGSAIELDASLAREALEREVARPLGLGLEEAAEGVVRLANASMGQLLRRVALERGLDLREAVLVAFGGCGAMHAAAVAAELGIRRVVSPAGAGVFSARGLLESELRYDHARTHLRSLGAVDGHELGELAEELIAKGRASLRAAEYADEPLVRLYADARYRGQNYEVRTPVALEALRERGSEAIREAFEAEYARCYPAGLPGREIELVSLRASAASPSPPPVSSLGVRPAGGRSEREARFAGSAPVRTPVLGRADLGDAPRPGPLVIADLDSTTLVPPGWSARRDAEGNVWLEAVR